MVTVTPPVVPMAHEPPVGEGMTASIGLSATAETDGSSEEGPLAVGTVFTGFQCEVPTAPAGTAWYPNGRQACYILKEQEIPPPEAFKLTANNELEHTVNADAPCANIQPWKGEGNKKRRIPIAVCALIGCADGCPLHRQH